MGVSRERRHTVEVITQHPSYGVITLTRRHSSRGKPLFGSAAKHEATAVVRISTATHSRKLNSNWHHADKAILEVELSLAQFAQFVMSSGQGEGVPCTLTYRQGTGYIEDCPPTNTREVFTGELNDYLNSMKVKIHELESEVAELVKKPKLSADDKRRLVSLTSTISGTLASNLEYLKTCFQEEVDQTLNAAKIELENFSNSLREQKQITGD
jgi:hypothetical protein